MAGNTFGVAYRITTFGESHGGAVGAVVDGCPPGLALDAADVQRELDRRKPGQSNITTPRAETDTVYILSGVHDGKTTGTPILLLAHNTDTKPEDYAELKNLYRPGHADYTYDQKYGIHGWSGSGRASARETLARVAAGAIAQKYLHEHLGIEIISHVQSIGNITADLGIDTITKQSVESNIVRCPDPSKASEMQALIEHVKNDGDSIGGVIHCQIRNVPAGLGEPVFDKISADLAKAMMSINAAKGFEIGSGFAGTRLRGSEHNDAFFVDQNGRIRTTTNHAGGTLGGISNGETITLRVAFKPVSTIAREQKTVTTEGKATTVSAHGRHDPCVLPRAVPIVDAMAAIVVMDHYLRSKTIIKE